KALLSLGMAYQKKSPAKAIETFQRLVNEYKDQKAAADQAQARLIALGGRRPAVFHHPSPDGPELFTRTLFEDERIGDDARVSSDGHYLAFVDRASTGSLMIRDLTSRSPELGRELVLAAGGEIRSPAFSRDGKRIAFAWRDPTEA